MLLRVIVEVGSMRRIATLVGVVLVSAQLVACAGISPVPRPARMERVASSGAPGTATPAGAY